MPSPFDITVASNTVNLDNKREGVATFTVHNNTRRRLRAAAQLTTQPPEAARWLTLLPPEGGAVTSGNVRDFPIDSTQQYQVKIVVPMDAPPGSATFKLLVADEVNPDDNFTESPDVMFTVREVPKAPPPQPLPPWLIPAIVIAVLVIVAIIAAVIIIPDPPEPTATPLPSPTATVVLGACTITMTNAQFTYQQPDVLNSFFDQVQAGAVFQPIGRSADNEWWQITQFDINVWLQTDLLANTATTSGDCSNLPAVCLLAITADANTYSKPNLANTATMAHAGWQFVPTGKLTDNSWWQFMYSGQTLWIPTVIFNTRATPNGDCSALPVVPAPP
jgi:hypothetical protein